MMRITMIETTLILFAVCATRLAAAEKAPRVALVIGNSDYAQEPLLVATRDATEIAKNLKLVGFEVETIINADLKATTDALSRLQQKIRANPQSDALVYYSGHGASLDQRAYLIPVNMPHCLTEATFKEQALDAKLVYDVFKRPIHMESPPGLSIVLLDACRNNPFTGGRVSAGLSEPVDVVQDGTIIGYAAPVGQRVPSTSDGEHSAYTKAILAHMLTPGVALADFFRHVRNSVLAYTDFHQTPWENTSQRIPFFFRDPVYVKVTVHESDDDVIVIAGNGNYIRTVDGRTKRLRLEPGDNLVTVAVVNYRSMRGGGAQREPWKYRLDLNVENGPSMTFGGEETEAIVPRERWGKTFLSARSVIRVDPAGLSISTIEQEPAIWLDGFSLAGTPAEQALDEIVRWAVVRRGVALFDSTTDQLKTIDLIRAGVVAAHEQAVVEHAKISTAHPEHDRAIAAMRDSSADALNAVVERLREGASREEIGTNLWQACQEENTRALCQELAQNADWPEMRELYIKSRNDDIETAFLIELISNTELCELYRRYVTNGGVACSN